MTKYFLVIALLFVGCASGQFAKNGGTEQELLKDKTDCAVKTTQAGYHESDFGSRIRYHRFYEQCLRGQGWSKI